MPALLVDVSLHRKAQVGGCLRFLAMFLTRNGFTSVTYQNVFPHDEEIVSDTGRRIFILGPFKLFVAVLGLL